jgi:hypothetical protein
VESTEVSAVNPREGKMPTTSPGPDRSLLGFAEAVERSFGFLAGEYGFRVVDVRSTFVRYETERAFVNVFHGRGSYELGVEIGRWIEVDGDLVEQKFPIVDVIALEHDLSAVGCRSFATTEKEPLGRFVAQLAEWTRCFAGRALEGDPAVFDAVSAQNTRRSIELQEGWTATRLRSIADDAWHRKDWGRVIDAYGEIVSELHTVELKPSEVGRLRYAQERLDASRS